MSLLSQRKRLLLAAGALLAPLVFVRAPRVHGSDHADTVENVQRPGADLSDVYIFPSPTTADNVVFVMNCHPLIPAGGGAAVSFDPNVLYQFHIDINGDSVDDLVIQAKFEGTGANQVVRIAGPAKPTSTGTTSRFLTPHATSGRINQVFSPAAGIQVFAGARKDPFFFDLERFLQILPDRGVPPGLTTEPSNPNAPQKTSFRGFPQTEAGAGAPTDFLANLNCLSIVVELPRAMLRAGA